MTRRPPSPPPSPYPPPCRSTTCTGTYVVTQPDVDAGQIVNTASTSGNPPTGPAVTANDTETVLIAARQSTPLNSSHPANSDAVICSTITAGDTLTSNFTITN